MTKALVIILFVAAFGLGAWALLGIADTAKTADQSGDAPAAQQTPPAPANPAPDQAANAPSSAQTPAAPAAPADQTEQPSAAGAPATTGAVQPSGGSPLDTAKKAEKGSLKSPYADFAKVAEEGHQKFMSAGCNGCHGGTGGGGMGPPLTNQVWIYGKDDDTLFRLVALGSDELKKQGYTRKGSENVVGPMPQMGGVVKSDDDLWKIIAWIRSINPSSAGSPSASAAPPASPPAQ